MAYAISASIQGQHTVKSLVNDDTDLSSVNPQDIDPEGMEFERPFNFFVAAGAAGRFGDHYSVTISPIDNTVQFEEAFPIITRFSLGAVYNPVAKKKEDVRKEYIETKRADTSFKQPRGTLAVALLDISLQTVPVVSVKLCHPYRFKLCQLYRWKVCHS